MISEVQKLTVGFKKLAWGSNQKNLPWSSKSYREIAAKKLTVGFKNLPWVRKVTVGFKKLAWGSKS